MVNDNNAKLQKVITGLVRFSYAKVFKAESVGENDEPKFSVSLIIPKSDKTTIAKIKTAVEAAKEAGKTSKFDGKLPATLKLPLRDGDEERPDDAAYANSYFVNASCLLKPGVVDKDCNPILDQDEFYSGCYGRASVTFYPFKAKGNKGVAAGLNNVQKIKDGESLGGRQSAEADFSDDFDDEDVDF